MQLNERRPCALDIGAIIEITDQNVAGGDCAAARKSMRDEGDTIWVEITVCGNRGGVDQQWKERLIGCEPWRRQ
jgi:hypothetical protein